MMSKVGMISLGCSKNRVDSEILLGYLRDYGFQLTPEAEDAALSCGASPFSSRS